MTEGRPVELMPHDPAWAAQARGHAEALRGALGPILITVHHIGSTSIPGIKAKPVIDLMPIVGSLDALDANAHAVTGLGYDWRGEFGIAGRRFCTLTQADGRRLVNVHFFTAESAEVAPVFSRLSARASGSGARIRSGENAGGRPQSRQCRGLYRCEGALDRGV